MNSNDNPNINSTSSKPIKKMVLWTRINNSKSTSPHLKDNSNAQKVKLKTIKSNKKEKEHISVCQKEKKICSPFLKSKDISNYSNNRNYLNYARITTNKLVNSQPGSFQSNSNDEEKNKLKINDSTNKKNERESNYNNNVKYKKIININYSPNANNINNINSSEFHINNTYKYFQSTNEINLKKKENKTNCITDNNTFINKSKNAISKKKISIDKDKKKFNNSKKKISPHTHKISPTSNKLSSSINANLNNNLSALNNNTNVSYRIFNQCKKNVNSIPSTKKLNKNTYNEFLDDSNSVKNTKIEIINNSKISKSISLEKIKNLELENKKLRNENKDLVKINKELKILINKLENEILEIKSVIKDNLNQFIEPQNDLVNKTYKQLMEQIDKQKTNLTKILNYKNSSVSIEENEKTKDESINNQKLIINDERNNFRIFKKNFFEFFNHVNISNTKINGYNGDNDPLKNTLNSFCSFMDNIMNKLEDNFINNDKKENKENKNNNSDKNILYNNYINNYGEICLINLYYEYIIKQLFIVSFFERQHCYYCYSIIDYILISPFTVIKNNDYIKDFTQKIKNKIYFI